MSKLGFTTFLMIIYSGLMYMLRSGLIPGIEIVIHPFTYIFILLIIISIFILRVSNYFSTRMQVVILVFFFSVFYYFSTANMGSFKWSCYLLELLITLIAFFLFHQMFMAIRQIQLTDARLTYSDIKYDIGVLEDAAKITESYLGRSKREKEHLTFLLIRYEPISFKKVKNLPKNRILNIFLDRRLEKNALRSILSNIRETDSFIETKDGCIILLPNTDREQAQFFIARLKENFIGDMYFSLNITEAEYPEDGESYSDLLRYCEKELM